MSVRVEIDGPITTIVLSRPEVKNAVDRVTADALATAFRAFDADPTAQVAVLWGEGGTFCAGADLKAVASAPERMNRVATDGDGPMGPTRMQLGKPVIAAIEGYAVAGGLELAAWCDLRVAAEDATLGVFCRRWGVPLIDGGTVRLPRLIGLSRALDLILTGRAVSAKEALEIGLVNRVVARGTARQEAEALARQIATFPELCMRLDRASAHAAFDAPMPDALIREIERGAAALHAGGTEGAKRFTERSRERQASAAQRTIAPSTEPSS